MSVNTLCTGRPMPSSLFVRFCGAALAPECDSRATHLTATRRSTNVSAFDAGLSRSGTDLPSSSQAEVGNLHCWLRQERISPILRGRSRDVASGPGACGFRIHGCGRGTAGRFACTISFRRCAHGSLHLLEESPRERLVMLGTHAVLPVPATSSCHQTPGAAARLAGSPGAPSREVRATPVDRGHDCSLLID
jgi:hypothetical protein